jgi:hypothetical protein
MIGNLELGKVGSPRGASVRLLADALDLTGPERQQFRDAARPLRAGSWSAPGRLAPCQLPPDVADFTGRAEQVRLLAELLGAAADGRVTQLHGGQGCGE